MLSVVVVLIGDVMIVCSADLKGMCSVLECQLGINFIDTEELTAGERALASVRTPPYTRVHLMHHLTIQINISILSPISC